MKKHEVGKNSKKNRKSNRASIRHRVSAPSAVPGSGALRTRGPLLIGRDMSAPVRAAAVQVLRGEAAALLGLPGLEVHLIVPVSIEALYERSNFKYPQ